MITWLHNGGYIVWFDGDRTYQFIDYYAAMFPYRRKETDPQGEGNWMVLK